MITALEVLHDIIPHQIEKGDFDRLILFAGDHCVYPYGERRGINEVDGWGSESPSVDALGNIFFTTFGDQEGSSHAYASDGENGETVLNFFPFLVAFLMVFGVALISVAAGPKMQ
ncbi:MAG: hypothetical protein GKC03_05405 [Methanomassiliicoccales archaeon]|nr:hypothetical protein [Methanomassiliicoccales archaeon]